MKKRYRIANRKKFITRTALLLFLSFCILSVPLRLVQANGMQEKQYREIVVKPGDTVWTIAESQNQDRDLRETVFEIFEANHLHSHIIQPGQTILVPVKLTK
ncbi:MAG TPA: LysM peptidoglycan-binding domain-containing protein [Clostridia bacterium]|nr:LysM peptidoglycan-binding domain-containing protein [Clostridia bacterium]